MLFVTVAIDKPNSTDLRMATREAHLAYAKASGKVKFGGPFLDEQGKMTGSMLVFEARDEAEARAFNAADPYVEAGLFERVETRAWKMTVNEIGVPL
jgi:uncharacterized protein YciI